MSDIMKYSRFVASNRLVDVQYKLAETLYKAGEGAEGGAPGAGPSADAGGAAPPDDDVIDAEYTEEKGDS